MCLQQSGNNSHQGLRLKLLSLTAFVTFFQTLSGYKNAKTCLGHMNYVTSLA